MSVSRIRDIVLCTVLRFVTGQGFGGASLKSLQTAAV